MRRLAAVIAVGVMLLMWGCGGWSQFTARANQTQSAAHVGKSGVRVETRNGRVEILGDPSLTEVVVESELRCGGKTQAEADARLAASHVEIGRSTSGEMKVIAVFPQPNFGSDGLSVKIRMPEAEGVVVKTSNGAITIRNLAGAAVLESSNGVITVGDHAGGVQAKSSNGAIELTGVQGGVEAETSNGRIKVIEGRGAVKATSSNGAIEVVLAESAAGPLHLRTSNGSVTVSVGGGFAGEVELDTSNGRVTLNDANNRCSKVTSVKKSEMRIHVGSEGEASEIDSSNGSITFTIR